MAEIEQHIFKYQGKKVELEEEFSLILNQIIKENPMNEYHWNDIGLSELFAKCFNSTALYCPEMKRWYVYNGEKWVKDEGATYVNVKIKQFADLMMLYCVQLAESEQKNEYTKFINKLGSRTTRDKLLKDAQCQLDMIIPINKFDDNPYLLNCLNGTYDLKSGKFHQFKATDYLTQQTNCNYPIATMNISFTRWNEFIDEIMCGDKALAKYLQKALGYSLLGIANEECMFIAYGQTTRNGKGTLLNTVQKVLGDYGNSIDVNFICRSKYGRNYANANPMICGLKGTRLLTMNESDDASKLDESLIKNYTGGDPISTRALYGEAFTFTPQFTMWLSANNLPNIYDKSVFSSERIKVIPFNRHFNKEEQDPNLKQKFMTDEAKTTIFKWLLDGYALYKREGLNNPPQAVSEQVEQYEKDNDIVALFIDEKCVKEEESSLPRNTIYSVFKTWCYQNGFQNLMSSQKFYKDCERLGIECKRKADGWYITGLALRKEEKGGIPLL